MSNSPKDHNIDWVHRRQRCSPTSVGLGLLESVREDVERVNLERVDKIAVDGSLRCFTVGATSHPPNARVAFRLDETTEPVRYIITGGPGFPGYEVTWKWNFETAECRFFLDGEAVDLWRIRQAALYSLFFPKG